MEMRSHRGYGCKARASHHWPAGAASQQLARYALDNGGDPLTHADAHRRQPEAAAAPLQLVHQSRYEAGTGATEWSPKGDAPTINSAPLGTGRSPRPRRPQPRAEGSVE